MYDLYVFVQSLFICHFALGRKEKKNMPPPMIKESVVFCMMI